MTSLATIPEELRGLIATELNATDLLSYCHSNGQLEQVCKDKSFWWSRVTQKNQQSLQRDWLIPFAQRGALDYLNILLDIVDAKKIVLDDWALYIVDAYLTRRDENGVIPGRVWETVRRVMSMISERSWIDVHKGEISDMEEYMTTALSFWQSNLTAFREFPNYDLLQPSHQFVVQYLDQLVSRSFLEKLPSPSYLLALILSSKDYDDETEDPFFLLLINFFLPFLAREGSVEELRTFNSDLIRLRHEITAYENDKDLAIGMMEQSFTDAVVFHGSLATVRALGVDLQQFAQGISGFSYRYKDVDVFKTIARFSDYQPAVSSRGYICMAPNQWIDWFKTIPSTANKQSLIKYTIDKAKDDGFTYFVNVVTDYQMKEYPT